MKKHVFEKDPARTYILERSWGILGRLGTVFGGLEGSWATLGALLAALGALLAAVGGSLAALGHSWAALGRSWGALGPLLKRCAKIIKKSMPKMTDLDPPKPPKITCFVAISHTHAGKSLFEK